MAHKELEECVVVPSKENADVWTDTYAGYSNAKNSAHVHWESAKEEATGWFQSLANVSTKALGGVFGFHKFANTVVPAAYEAKATAGVVGWLTGANTSLVSKVASAVLSWNPAAILAGFVGIAVATAPKSVLDVVVQPVKVTSELLQASSALATTLSYQEEDSGYKYFSEEELVKGDMELEVLKESAEKCSLESIEVTEEKEPGYGWVTTTPVVDNYLGYLWGDLDVAPLGDDVIAEVV